MLNSYVKKVPFKIVVLAKLFPLMEKISTKLVVREGLKMFFRPIRFQIPGNELKLRNQAKVSYHNTSENKIAVLQWISNEDAPYVLLMHGWASRSTHFNNFIETLLSQGYNIICPEAPGHGLSGGNRSDIIRFGESIAVAHKLVKPKYWLCHSMGGSAAMYCINQFGCKPEHLSIIASPAIAFDILQVFTSRLGLSESLIPLLNARMEKMYDGKKLKDYTAEYIIQKLPTDTSLNLVYDTADDDAPVAHGKRLKELYPNADLKITEKLGHVKIIKNPDVLSHCQSFWKEHQPQV
jgi:pimeloyl-ACP methyl ester carboxylesterase